MSTFTLPAFIYYKYNWLLECTVLRPPWKVNKSIAAHTEWCCHILKWNQEFVLKFSTVVKFASVSQIILQLVYRTILLRLQCHALLFGTVGSSSGPRLLAHCPKTHAKTFKEGLIKFKPNPSIRTYRMPAGIFNHPLPQICYICLYLESVITTLWCSAVSSEQLVKIIIKVTIGNFQTLALTWRKLWHQSCNHELKSCIENSA